MKIELFHSVGCTRCASSQDGLREVAMSSAPDVVWRQVDALEELDYAVELGVLTLPAIAIDGELVFSSLPTAEQLARAVRLRHAEPPHGR